MVEQVCLVDEVVETIVEDDAEGVPMGPNIVAADIDDAVLGTFGGDEDAQETSATPSDMRARLTKLFEAYGEDGDDSGSAPCRPKL